MIMNHGKGNVFDSTNYTLYMKSIEKIKKLNKKV